MREISRRKEAVEVADPDGFTTRSVEKVFITAEDRYGNTRELVFNSDPTDAQVLTALTRGREVAPATKAQFEELLEELENKMTMFDRLAAKASGAGDTVLANALTARALDVYTNRIKPLIQAWRTAN